MQQISLSAARAPAPFASNSSPLYVVAPLQSHSHVTAPVACCRRLLFSADFRRHIEAADLLLMQLPDIADAAVSCLDLLLRWAVLRLCDANTQCLLKVLDLCKALFDVCQDMVSLLKAIRQPMHQAMSDTNVFENCSV